MIIDTAQGATSGATSVGASAHRPPADAAAAGLRLSGLGKVLGGRTVVDALDLDVADGELVCLLGPSGCGKTTTLRMVGGFVTPDTGSVAIGGTNVTGLSPDRRPTAMVFQNYALWPHMTVAGNVAYGLKIRRVARSEITRRVTEVLELVNLTHHRDSYPARISGGEQQRAALARALVLRPRVLLLDEPLSNLDAKLRVRVREDIRRIQQDLHITTVLVTHDQDEALSVADRVAVMNAGRIEQVSTPRELYRSPRTRFVAEFVGTMNLHPGRVVSGGVDLGGSLVPVTATGSRSPLEQHPGSTGGGTVDIGTVDIGTVDVGTVDVGTVDIGTVDIETVDIGIRPEDLRVVPAVAPDHRGTPGAPGVPGRIVREVPRGAVTELVVQVGSVSLRALLPADRDPARDFPGGQVAVSAVRALVYRDGLLAGTL